MSARSLLSNLTLSTVTISAAFAMALATGCGEDDTPMGDDEDDATTGVGLDCTPGEEIDCECSDGSMGTQVCLTANEAGPCDCGYSGGYEDPDVRSETKTFDLSGEAVSPSVEFSFSWHNSPGRPAFSDLDVQLPGQADPVLQVFSDGDQPYVRAGLVVKAIVPERKYTAFITAVDVTLRAPDGKVVVEQSLDLPAFDHIEYRVPKASIYAAPVVVDSIRER